MKDNCLDIGIIQAFLDGEISFDESARVSGHIADCDTCALMLAEAEGQSAFVFSALERELDTLVPTQRLWSRINESIEADRAHRPLWEKAYAFLRVSLLNPSLAAAAGLLIVLGISALVFIDRTPAPNNAEVPASAPVATTGKPSLATPPVADQVVPVAVVSSNKPETVTAPTNGFRVERAVDRSATRRTSAGSTTVTPAVLSNGYLPGEESYVRTISTLAKTVDEQKDNGIMRASERVAYERDMAVVNDAISRLKKEVKRNPTNETAKQVLYSSYQNKIDLLNSVAQREELLVSLR